MYLPSAWNAPGVRIILIGPKGTIVLRRIVSFLGIADKWIISAGAKNFGFYPFISGTVISRNPVGLAMF